MQYRSKSSSNTNKYESYVQTLFTPAYAQLSSGTDTRPVYKSNLEPQKDVEGALDMLESVYRKSGLEDESARVTNKFRVYQPKSSSEYYATMNRHGMGQGRCNPASHYKDDHGPSCPIDTFWNHNLPMEQNRYRLSFEVRRFHPPPASHNLIIDFSQKWNTGEKSIHIPHSRFWFPTNDYLHLQDSRHLGSNFTWIALRPPDPFLGKVDKLLDRAKRV